MRIGIDFDNTLASYDHLFECLAARRGLLPQGFRGGKKSVRDLLRQGENGEAEWTRLQAEVYGTRMHEAELVEGAAAFLAACRRHRTEVFVVSHKTRHAAADPDGIDLHHVSLAWMETNGFFDSRGLGLARDNVFFEPTRQAKCRRIAMLGCSHFIDDLEEVFSEPEFPHSVRGVLLCRGGDPVASSKFETFRNWDSITDAIFGHG